MSQNDFTIANQGFPAFRADLNSALQALASNSSGTSAPSTTFANMWWYDSSNNIMYIRNEDNDAWIKFAELDQTNDKFVLSGTLQLDDGTVSAPALTFNSDTNMGIYRGGTDILKFVTAGTDAITIDASQNVTLANNLSITGNGSTSDLTGSNIFRIMGDDVRITNSAGSEAMATSTADGSVTLYHDASPKIATTSTGIQVTGNIANASGNLTIDVVGQLVINSDSGQIVLQDDTVNWGNLQNSSGDFVIESLGTDKDMIFKGLDGSSVITALTIDMSAGGNVLIGTTDNNPAVSNIIGTAIRNDGEMEISASAKVLDINTQTDGDIAVFRKNGTSVGSIGTLSGYLTIGDDVGILFNNANPSISAFNASTNANRDGAIDIGASNARFKDLYLSGGVYLGGTSSLHKLDDYEEGTWIPVLEEYGGTPTTADAHFTKIGRVVHASVKFLLDGSSDPSSIRISGLPFTSLNTTNSLFGGYVSYTNSTFTNNIFVFVASNGTDIRLYTTSGSSVSYNDIGANKEIRLVAIYFTT